MSRHHARLLPALLAAIATITLVGNLHLPALLSLGATP